MATMQVITMPTVIPPTTNSPDSRAVTVLNTPAWLVVFGRFFWLPAVPVIVMCVYLSFVHSLVLMGERTNVFPSANNAWLDVAENLDVLGIPDIYEAQGLYFHQQGMLLEGAVRTEVLERSAAYWDSAARLRPDWPYYPLSALAAEVAYNAPAKRIQDRLDQLMQIAPNERGLYLNLFQYAFLAWDKLRIDQQGWILQQVQLPGGNTFSQAVQAAKHTDKLYLLCAKLPWNKIGKFCR